MNEKEVRQLIEQAKEARTTAYSPYYKIYVGAALLAEDGSIHTGCNVENAVGAAITCAESNALGGAVVKGQRNFRAIALIGSENAFAYPCGGCRQKLAEFNPSLHVYVANSNGKYKHHSLADLLPYPYET